ncbi:KPN_02809 family neutral zinc metallopeptidase [Terricaulis silvestris]|uniref:Putative metalloprotease n=1 Tax=Terricaulis silvestris TaxID=2686094 RepID=A0A6I6MU51_9CAUL|nr:neutral zinc metallopeptidase [Terricaulis silvestris]QGZ96297.1 putative metalloprotease [Terricaulis silvestris]
MRTDNQRRSDNFEDRGRGGGGAVGGGLAAGALFAILRRIGLRGILIVGLVLAGIWFFAPANIKEMVFGALLGGVPGQSQSTSGEGSVCEAEAQACDFSRAVLGSTEDVWSAQFSQNRLPNYSVQAGSYRAPTLVVFSGGVATGCGNATADVGPFYCPADTNLYIDPSFYQVMQSRLNAPGDFAQAYVIAHEVGHHVQNLIGATQRSVSGENQNQTSVRVELQADCLAGVWGHTARASLAIDEADLREALNAAHAIGDDTLGANAGQYTHGTSAQRMRWFRRGFDSGDARQCDTFAVSQAQL